MLCDCVQVDTVGNSYRYLGTPTFDGRYLGTLDIKGLQDLLYLRYPGTHTFDLERGTWGTQVPLLSISELSKEGPDFRQHEK